MRILTRLTLYDFLGSWKSVEQYYLIRYFGSPLTRVAMMARYMCHTRLAHR